MINQPFPLASMLMTEGTLIKHLSKAVSANWMVESSKWGRESTFHPSVTSNASKCVTEKCHRVYNHLVKKFSFCKLISSAQFYRDRAACPPPWHASWHFFKSTWIVLWGLLKKKKQQKNNECIYFSKTSWPCEKLLIWSSAF